MPSNIISLGLLSLAALAAAAPERSHSWSKPDCSQPAPTGRGARWYNRVCNSSSDGAAATGADEIMEAPVDTAVVTESLTVTNVQTIVVSPSPVADVVSTVTAEVVNSTPAAAQGSPIVNANYRKTSSSVAAAATTPAAAASTGSTVSSSSGTKRGVCYNDATKVTPFGSAKKVTWAYNWGSSSSGLGSNFEYIPMLWGNGAGPTKSWVADATKAIAAGSSALLGFNEPDHSEQANIPYSVAATAYKTLITTPFAGKARLGSPAVTNGGGSMGLNYLTNFMNACSSCQIDFVAVHWYDSATNIQYFKDHITQAHTLTGKPIWVTEFGTTGGSADQIDTFVKTVIPWLDQQPFVERYSYFMAKDGILNSGSGLSNYGQSYATI